MEHPWTFENCAGNAIAHLLTISLQNSMDLPPDKAKLLKNYDDEKKWELVCDQVNLFLFSTFVNVIH